ncbi:hypothetical protein TWF694_002580 [Orbilia ellipsospora]|uniref:Uncharacterized protein n=1 Tax=Orbilia ellipsospora TaxID=2528407 RepID=A0AAV9X3Q3_9PEZI
MNRNQILWIPPLIPNLHLSSPPTAISLSVFRLNKQIHAEASEIFHKETGPAARLQTRESAAYTHPIPWPMRVNWDNRAFSFASIILHLSRHLPEFINRF